MSRENEEVVRRVLEANTSADAEGGLAVALSLSHPSMEFVSVMAEVEPRTYRGHEGLRRYFSDLAENFDAWRMEVEETMTPAPDTVLAMFRTHITGKTMGVELITLRAVVCRLAGGKLVWARVYPSREDALEALGLPG